MANLSWLAQNSGQWGAFYVQTANIDASETQYWDDSDDGDGDLYNDPNDSNSNGNNEGFSPIGNGTYKFTGSYNGDGHTVDALVINRSGTPTVGLFGWTDSAYIGSLGVTDVDITGNNYVGGLAGYVSNSSTVTECYSTGSVSGNVYVGGLAGRNYSSSTIRRSFSTAAASGNNTVGGLVARNGSGCTVSDCYSTGSVSRSSGASPLSTNFGGFGGYNYQGEISSCYSIGSVYYIGYTDPSDKAFVGGADTGGTYAMSDNFWDQGASNQSSNSAGGAAGKTTAEMKDVATFTDETTPGLDHAWDFVGNPNDDIANEDIWDMDSSHNGYPYLSWQHRRACPPWMQLLLFNE